MARAKKKTTSKRTKKAPARKTAKKTPKKTPKKAAKKKTAKKAVRGPTKAAGRSKKETDVERRWREYWECRTGLEEAVAAVTEIQEQLAEAREVEQNQRAVFEETKNALKTLLEVEAPGAGGSRPSGGMGLLSLADDDDEPPPPAPDPEPPAASDEDESEDDSDDDDDSDDSDDSDDDDDESSSG